MAQAVRGAQFGLTLSWLFACALRAASEQTPIPEGAPFHLAADVATGSALDVSFLLQRPAGAQGRVRAQGERFVFGDGTPARFWGVNLCADALYPPKGEAAAIAKRLAMSGCNLVRIGYWDGGTGGVFRQDLDNTSTIDPERLDRLDYFFAQLKDAGVYSLLVLSMGRRSLKSGDVGGVFDAEAAPAAYQIGRFFDPRTRQADETVWRSLLGHGNPYTGLRWADDLAIMGIEILNESSLYYAYRLFTGLPEALTAKVQQQWNQWLVKRYPNREELVRHWGSENIRPDEDPNGGTVALDFSLLRDPLWRDNPSSLPREGRGNDWNRFLAEVCRDYYLTEIRFLRELGVQQPVACNGGGSLVAADVWSNRVGDFFTQHSYHDHPNWDGPMYYSNASALKSGLLPIPGLSLRRLAAMPYGASEYDFCFPNDWRAEGGPAVAAYAAFQGWSLATRFAYWSHPWEGREAMYSSTSGIRSIWRIHSDPAAFGQWPLTALIFLRGDVREALKTVDIGFSETDTFYRERHRFPPAHLRFLDSVPFVHKTRWTHFDQVYKGDADLVVSSGRSTSGDYSHAQAAILASANLRGDPYGLQEGAFKAPKRATARSPDEVAKRENGFREAVQQLPGGAGDLLPAAHDGWIVSDTRELRYRRDPGILIVDTPRTQGVVGFVGGQSFTTQDLVFRLENDFGSVLASSLDGRPLREASRILVVAVGRCQNADFQRLPQPDGRFKATGKSLGTGPILIEPLRFTMTLPVGDDTKPLSVHALDGAGQRIANIPSRQEGNSLFFSVDGKPTTIYYELVK